VLPLMSECNYAKLPVFCSSDATHLVEVPGQALGPQLRNGVLRSTGFRSESKTVWVERKPGEAQPVTVTIGKSDANP
jgi:hypothetical protein